MKFLLIFLLLVFFNGYAFSGDFDVKTSEESFASSPDDELFYNVTFGISPFDGLVGIEFQKRNHSVGLGIPWRVSYRYYADPDGDSPFYGFYLGRFKEQGDGGKTYKGISYKDAEGVDMGIGAGYRWQWPSGWNVTGILSLHYMDKEYSSPGQSKKYETLVLLFPGINVGYKF